MRIAFAGLALALAVTHNVAAQTGDEASRKAKAHFKIGQDYIKAGEYDHAITEFTTAYKLAPLPDLLFNLGQAYRLKGEPEKAIDFYTRYVEAKPDGPTSDEAREHIVKLTKLAEQKRAQETAQTQQREKA